MTQKKYINVTIKNKWLSIWNKQNTKLNKIKRETNRWLNAMLHLKKNTVLN